MGVRSGDQAGAPGWPATDWVEDMMLRTQTPDVYDQWVTNEDSFTDDVCPLLLMKFGGICTHNGIFVCGGAGAVCFNRRSR